MLRQNPLPYFIFALSLLFGYHLVELCFLAHFVASKLIKLAWLNLLLQNQRCLADRYLGHVAAMAADPVLLEKAAVVGLAFLEEAIKILRLRLPFLFYARRCNVEDAIFVLWVIAFELVCSIIRINFIMGHHDAFWALLEDCRQVHCCVVHIVHRPVEFVVGFE